MRHRSAEPKSQAESHINQKKKAWEEHADTIPDEEKAKTETALEELKTVLEGDNLEDIKAKTDALMQASMAIGDMAYISSPEISDEQPVWNTAPLGQLGNTNSGNDKPNAVQFQVLLNSSRQLRARGNNSITKLHVALLGWYDRRGRDD